MERNLQIMEKSIIEGVEGVTSVTGLTGGDSTKLNSYIIKGEFLSGETILQAVRNAIAVNEVNAKMGLICATPTAGSAGVVPGVLMAIRDKLKLNRHQQLEFQSSHALAITLKNMMGLICDPVAGLVEVPCVKRNALGSSQAFISADMALSGIESVIPPDEVVEAMYQVGKQLPSAFRETAEGGLAVTPTAKSFENKLFNKNIIN